MKFLSQVGEIRRRAGAGAAGAPRRDAVATQSENSATYSRSGLGRSGHAHAAADLERASRAESRAAIESDA
jgi:hypothetical protein